MGLIDTNDIDIEEDAELFSAKKVILDEKYDKVTAKQCAKPQTHMTPEQRE